MPPDEAIFCETTALRLRLHVQPNAAKSVFSGLHGDRLKVRLQARPVEGAANEALRRFVAKVAGLPRADVEILRGQSSRQKELRLHCSDPPAVARRLRQAAGLETGPDPEKG